MLFFGRGVKPTGFNNTVSDGDYESSFSELIWEGPDGSQVLGIFLPTGIRTAMKFLWIGKKRRHIGNEVGGCGEICFDGRTALYEWL